MKGKGMITEECIIHDLPIEKYHADPAISKTILKRWHDSPTPAHFKAFKEEEKDALNFGSILHLAVLEPEKYDKQVVVAPKDVLSKSGSRAGKAWYAWEEEQLAAGKSILLPDEKSAVDFALEEIFQNPQNREAAELLDPKGVSEVSFFWQDFETGHMKKCRPDKLPGNGIVVDLKSAASAEPDEFGKNAARMKYHWSCSISLEGVTECTKMAHTDYRFIVVEKEAPFGVMVYKIEEEDIRLAREQVREEMRTLTAAMEANDWPCYPDGTHPLRLPYWERTQWERKMMGQVFYES